MVREAACSLGQICLLRESGLIKLQLKRKKRMLGRASPGLSSSAWAGVWRNNLQRNKRHTGIPETWLADGADAVFTRGGLGERSLQMGVNRRGCKTGGRLLGKLSLEQSFLSLGSTGIWWRGGGAGAVIFAEWGTVLCNVGGLRAPWILPLDVTTKNVARHCQMSPGEQNLPPSTTC